MIGKVIIVKDFDEKKIGKNRPAIIVQDSKDFFRVVPFTSSTTTEELSINIPQLEEWENFKGRKISLGKSKWVTKDKIQDHLKTNLILELNQKYNIVWEEQNSSYIKKNTLKIKKAVRGSFIYDLQKYDQIAEEYTLKRKGAGVQKDSGMSFKYMMLDEKDDRLNLTFRDLYISLWEYTNKKKLFHYKKISEEILKKMEKPSEVILSWKKEQDKIEKYIINPFKKQEMDGLESKSRNFKSVDFLNRYKQITKNIMVSFEQEKETLEVSLKPRIKI